MRPQAELEHRILTLLSLRILSGVSTVRQPLWCAQHGRGINETQGSPNAFHHLLPIVSRRKSNNPCLVLNDQTSNMTNKVGTSTQQHLHTGAEHGHLSTEALKAHEFEKAYRAHSSVFEDSFYKVPPGSAEAPAGALLKVEREVDPNLYNIPPNHAISRFMYQSQKSDGSLVPVTAYILWPYIARTHRQGHPVVAWAHGTSGVNPESAPSNLKHLWHDFQVVYQVTLNGYVIVATDYAGLGLERDGLDNEIVHEYMTGPAQGNDVIFSVKAARVAFPELSEDFVIIGDSEGGQAAWAAAERLYKEPLPTHLGTIAISPLTRLLSLPETGWAIPLLVIMLVPALQQRFHDFGPEDVLTPKGVQILQTYRALNGCNTLLFQLPCAHDTLRSDWQTNSHIQEYQKTAFTGGKQIRGPLLVMHGDSDSIVTMKSVTEAVHATAEVCPAVHIAYHVLPNVSHVPGMFAGQPIWMDWIAARFAREPLEPGLFNHVAKPIRPESTQLKEANWYIQNKTESWQSR